MERIWLDSMIFSSAAMAIAGVVSRSMIRSDGVMPPGVLLFSPPTRIISTFHRQTTDGDYSRNRKSRKWKCRQRLVAYFMAFGKQHRHRHRKGPDSANSWESNMAQYCVAER